MLVNPTAGRGAGRVAGLRALGELRQLGHTVVDLTGGDLAEARAHLDAEVAALDAVVVVGGDGLVHVAVEAVAGTATALGVVPAGTGNDLARGLDLELGDPALAVQRVSAALREGRSRAVDAVRVRTAERDGWFVSILASGVDALINERANAWRWPSGPSRYTLAAITELARVRSVALRVVLDGDRVLDVDALLVAVANTRSYGGGLRMAPDADPTDGLLDVVVVDALPAARALRLFPLVRPGRHLSHPAVHVHRARSVRLEVRGGSASPRPHADGEPAGSLPVTCEVVPGALRVLA
nr:diacylglycerol kinase family protein [Kineococcus siccus]